MPNSKIIGGILLIIGTSLGGGMLALPIATAPAGLIGSVLFLFLCWLVMTLGALLVLEVNLRLPKGSNIISMAKNTLGLPGEIASWIAYLFLLYTLLAAYISGGTDILSGILKSLHIDVPDWVSSILFTSGFSMVTYGGIKAVDYVNRAFMFGKLGIYLLLVLIISPYIHIDTWAGGSLRNIYGSIMILITSFGFASIVPSLRDYFDDDIKALKRAIIFGSLIPLVCYITWVAVIMGALEREGAHGILSLMNSPHTTRDLSDLLSLSTHNNWIMNFFRIFSYICMITAFLGVSIGLFDFIADGFKLKKSGIQKKIILSLTFIPPLAVVLFNNSIYLKALNYAGISCVILLLFLPSLMAWKSRKHIQGQENTVFIPGGNVTLLFTSSIAMLLLIISI